MTLLAGSSGQSILRPEEVQELVIQPLIAQAVCTRISTVIQTGSHSTRFPIVVTDPATGWTPEGEEINISDPDLDELVVTPPALKGLTVVSNELMADSDPTALEVVGAGLVRDLQTKLDAAYFGDTVSHGPNGLESLTDVQVTETEWTGNLDPFAEAISLCEQVGVQPVEVVNGRPVPGISFVAHPADVLTLSTMKVQDGSNQPLLGPDATSVTSRSVLGVPLYSAAAVTRGIAWAVPRSRVFVVLRTNPEVVADRSAFFSSDSTGIRCVLRVGFGFPHQAAIAKVVIDGGS